MNSEILGWLYMKGKRKGRESKKKTRNEPYILYTHKYLQLVGNIKAMGMRYGGGKEEL